MEAIEPSSIGKPNAMAALTQDQFRRVVYSLFRQHKNVIEISDSLPGCTVEAVIAVLKWYKTQLLLVESEPVFTLDRLDFALEKLWPGVEAGSVAYIKAYGQLTALKARIEGFEKLPLAQQPTEITIGGMTPSDLVRNFT